MPKKPWYHAGLRFTCTECGSCCTGAPGYVWVNDEEIELLARTVEMDVAAFEDSFVRKVGGRKSLREFANGDCAFFDNVARCCKVYPARPQQCRTWPFWPSNIESREAWNGVCQACPGSGRGELVSLPRIRAQAGLA